MNMQSHVVMFSGGLGSWATAKLVAERYGVENLTLLFSDVRGNGNDPNVGEDPDTYRFLEDAAINVGAPLTRVADGRNIWEVFRDVRYLGNSRLAQCSHLLKQKPARDWLESHRDPEDTTVHIGIDWTETHRIPAVVKNYKPYSVECILTEPPFLTKNQIREWAESEGLEEPRLYALGFPHNNCGGGCVRAGQGQFKLLLEKLPERYARWEKEEQGLREFLDKDVSILRDQKDGVRRRLPLSVLRSRVEADDSNVDTFDFGGCGCFVTDETKSESA